MPGGSGNCLGSSVSVAIHARAWEEACITSNAANAVDDAVGHLLADGVVATGIVVGGILLAADQQLGVEQLAVGTSADLVDRGRVEVDEKGAGDVYAIARLGEEGLERATLA